MEAVCFPSPSLFTVLAESCSTVLQAAAAAPVGWDGETAAAASSCSALATCSGFWSRCEHEWSLQRTTVLRTVRWQRRNRILRTSERYSRHLHACLHRRDGTEKTHGYPRAYASQARNGLRGRAHALMHSSERSVLSCGSRLDVVAYLLLVLGHAATGESAAAAVGGGQRHFPFVPGLCPLSLALVTGAWSSGCPCPCAHEALPGGCVRLLPPPAAPVGANCRASLTRSLPARAAGPRRRTARGIWSMQDHGPPRLRLPFGHTPSVTGLECACTPCTMAAYVRSPTRLRLGPGAFSGRVGRRGQGTWGAAPAWQRVGARRIPSSLPPCPACHHSRKASEVVFVFVPFSHAAPAVLG